MLKEKIIYRNELPVNVITANIQEYPIHFHDDMEVVYVLRGRIIMRNGYYTYTLKEGDIYIINDLEMHSFENAGEDNMVMMLQIDLSYFSRYYDNLKNNFFVTDMDDDNDESLEVLRGILARIMMEVLQKGYGYEHKVIESTHNLIACLLADFHYFVMDDGKFRNETKNKGNKILAGRLNRITDYMYDNYNRKLTLGEIAEREHLSIYYLSHVIKESTGLSFQELLSYIRVEASEKFLLGTNKKIGAIAEEVGFSAVRYYIKHFEYWFGMHPQEYRRKFAGKVISRESGARFELCAPAQIEDAIRCQATEVYGDYLNRMRITPVSIDIDKDSDLAGVIEEQPPLAELMERPQNAVLADPYNKLMHLGENVIAAGENYIVTTSCKFPGALDSMSVLVYNIDENMAKTLRRIGSQEELLHVFRRYDRDGEFLIRSNGLEGEFRILRWRLDTENVIRRIEIASGADAHEGLRQRLLDDLLGNAAVSSESFITADTLSIRAVFKGIGAELIMVDRK